MQLLRFVYLFMYKDSTLILLVYSLVNILVDLSMHVNQKVSLMYAMV